MQKRCNTCRDATWKSPGPEMRVGPLAGKTHAEKIILKKLFSRPLHFCNRQNRRGKQGNESRSGCDQPALRRACRFSPPEIVESFSSLRFCPLQKCNGRENNFFKIIFYACVFPAGRPTLISGPGDFNVASLQVLHLFCIFFASSYFASTLN